MNIVTKDIVFNDETLTLTNHRAVYWAKNNTLILSDLHIGKTAHFRKHGIAVPDTILQKDLERLKNIILYFEVKTLLVVGDLFHAEANIDFSTFKEWLHQFKTLNIHLIKGNHDRVSQRLISEFNIQLDTKITIGKLTFVHEHNTAYDACFTISGHTHPGVFIKGKAKQRIKLPCYQVTKQQMILPAFSLFTGLNTNAVPKNAINYAFTDSGIYEIE